MCSTPTCTCRADAASTACSSKLRRWLQELAHDVAVHIGLARPKYLSRDDVPAEVVDAERATLETITRNEGKPEAAVPKIVEGRIQGFFKDVALLDQPYAKDDKQSVTQVLNGATVVRYAQSRSGDRMSASPRWKRIVFKPSGEALAGPLGKGPTARPSSRPPRRSRTSGNRWMSTSPWSSAAATSGVAAPERCPGWMPPSPTTSACWAR
ncbi:MAG: hypothetical protein R2705_08640 [Ilumatobacteraceae bacterium]